MSASRGTPPRRVGETVGLLAELLRNARLVWRLLNDGRVPHLVKAVPVLALLYILSPIDLVPDPLLGLGQLDDIAVLLLAVKLFIELSPHEVVHQHQAEMASVDGVYRVVDEEPGSTASSTYIEIPYSVSDEEREGE